MSAPNVLLKVNQSDNSNQTSPSWFIAFLRQENPASAYTKGTTKEFTWRPPLLIENDCIGVSYQGAKNGHAKSCSLTMKAQEVYYLGAVSPGDWCLVWMVNSQEDADNIRLWFAERSPAKSRDKRQAVREKSFKINGWNSGLKFIGRVGRVGSATAVQQNGVKTITQTVQCQAFVEMVNSLYFTTAGRATLPSLAGTIDPLTGKERNSSPLSKQDALLTGLLRNAIGEDNLNSFRDFFPTRVNSENLGRSPDELIPLIFLSIMGVTADLIVAQGAKTEMRSNFGVGIRIPKVLAEILGSGNEEYLWELYNVYSGIQVYGPRKAPSGEEASPYLRMAPHATVFKFPSRPQRNVFFSTGKALRGRTLYLPSLWENRDIWGFMRSYLFEQINEMYTVFRCNQFNEIKPTLVVREKPFGTGLFNTITNGAVVPTVEDPRKSVDPSISAPKRKKTKSSDKKLPRAQFHSHPRWAIDSGLILAVNLSTEENDRVNFVQININPETIKKFGVPSADGFSAEAQFAAQNYVLDEIDVSRNGLRAMVTETHFVDNVNADLIANETARIMADHVFNGHLKLKGSITLKGIQEPICEGDNVQIGFTYTKDGKTFNRNTGIVLHIEAVSHQASIGPGGQKTFNTTLTVSRGVLAGSLTSDKDIPQYAHEVGGRTTSWQNAMPDLIPGITDIQKNIHSNRNEITGEIIEKNFRGKK